MFVTSHFGSILMGSTSTITKSQPHVMVIVCLRNKERVSVAEGALGEKPQTPPSVGPCSVEEPCRKENEVEVFHAQEKRTSRCQRAEHLLSADQDHKPHGSARCISCERRPVCNRPSPHLHPILGPPSPGSSPLPGCRDLQV